MMAPEYSPVALSPCVLLPGSRLPFKKPSFLMQLHYKEGQEGSEQADPYKEPRPPAQPRPLSHGAGVAHPEEAETLAPQSQSQTRQ